MDKTGANEQGIRDLLGKTLEDMDDLEIAARIGYHLDNPCGFGLHNIREFYLREAKRLIPKLSPQASAYLEAKIKEYS